MEGIGVIIAISFLITFGPPVLFFFLGLANRNRNPNSSKIMFIIAAVWLIIGGGLCLSILA